MILFRRFLPFLSALICGVAFYVQSLHPSWYPELAVIPAIVGILATVVIAWKHMEWKDVLEKMSPMWIFLCAVGFAQLLLESPVAHLSVAIGGGVGALIGLELLFLYTHDPVAYPMHGLSYFNIALVPAIMYLALSTSWGIWVFVHSPAIWHIVLGAILGAVLFRTTGHPGATVEQNRVWMIVGLLTGIELSWIMLHLPFGMPMQGAIAAVISTAVLRVRRYLYEPRPPKLLERFEIAGVFVSLIVICSTAKWI